MKDKDLRQDITLTGALSTVMGTVIGAGLFFKTATVVAHTHSAGASLLAWLFAGALTICGGLSVAELATAMPKTGGSLQYIEAIYGKLPAFLLGWTQSIIYYPANIAALCIIFVTQLTHLFQLPTDDIIPLAIITAVSVTAINLLGNKLATAVQSLTLWVKLVPIFAIVLAGLLQPNHVAVSVTDITITNEQGWLAGFNGALLAALFAYDGWMGVTNIAGEMKQPRKDLPKAIILGLSFVTIIYWLVNFIFLRTLPVNAIAANTNAASDVAFSLFGQSGGKIVTLGILVSVYGAINGFIMAGLRVPYAMAVKGEFPFSRLLKKVSPKAKIPYISALVQLSLACFMMLLGNFDNLTDVSVFVMWLFNLLLFIGVLIFRKQDPDHLRPYRVPLYPLTPILAIVGAVFIVIMTISSMPKVALVGIGLITLGIPVYWLIQKHKKSPTLSGRG